jgi:CheY-like chemotaxis protein
MDTLRVLVVEDSPVHQRLLVQAFQEARPGARLEVRGDAESAWEEIQGLRFQAHSHWPDFILIDVNLPGMSGIELLDRIRKLPRFEDLPIVVLTGSTDPEDQAESLLAEATLYAQKPTKGGWAPLVGQVLDLLGFGVKAAPGTEASRKSPARKLRSTGRPE